MKWKFDIICVLIGRTNMKRAELTAFSEGDYFILINHSFATERRYHTFTPLRTRGVERDLLPERFTLPGLTN